MKGFNQKAFTLVELIIVIAVIGVLAAILIPVFSNVIDKANAKSALSDARNTMENYVSQDLMKRSEEGGGLPENFVMIVYKANKYYVFGYNTAQGGTVQVSDGNPYKVDSLAELVDNYSWNARHEGTPYNPAADESTLAGYTIESDGAFYFVPYVSGESQNALVRSFRGISETEDYRSLRSDMDEVMGQENDIAIYHGCLVGTSYIVDGPQNPDEPGDTPTGYTVTFRNADSQPEGFDAAKATLPTTAENVTTFIPASYASACTYAAPGADDEYTFVFDSFAGYTSAASLSGDITVEVKWKKVEFDKFTLTFDKGTGDSMDLGSYTNGTSFLTNKDVTGIITAATAAKTGCTFVGWKLDAEHIYTSSSTGITITADMTLTAQFEAIEYNISYNLKGGTNAQSNPSSYTIETETFTLAAPTKADNDFIGWTYIGQSDPTTTVTISKGSMEPRAYTAHWQHSYLIFDSNTHTVTGTKANISQYAKVVIPREINGISVTTVGQNAFDGTNLTEINFDGTKAQWEAINLDSEWKGDAPINMIICTDGVVITGEEGKEFNYTISDGEITITGLSEYGATLSELVIPDELYGMPVTAIGGRAFSDCTSFESVTIGKNVKKIFEEAFSCCSSLKTLEIGTGVEFIDRLSFANCTSLTELNIPGNVKTIEYEAFYGCEGVQSLTIGEGVETIENSAFYYCGTYMPAGSSVMIPSTVKYIGVSAFMQCGFWNNRMFQESSIFFYNGTIEQWEKIKKDIDWFVWGIGCNIPFVTCTDGRAYTD